MNNPYIREDLELPEVDDRRNINDNLEPTDKNPYPISNAQQFEEETQIDYETRRIIQLGFMRKVYGIVCFQLLITSTIASLSFIPEVKKFYSHNFWLLYTCCMGTVIVIIPLVCFRALSRKVPLNYILLIIFTLLESVMISYTIVEYDPKVVISAAILTILAVSGLTAYACLSSDDYTQLGGILVASLAVLFGLGILSFAFGGFTRILYCALGVVTFSVYLIYDTQLISGKLGTEFDIDEYIFAALNIYLDIVRLFIYILRILGEGSN